MSRHRKKHHRKVKQQRFQPTTNQADSTNVDEVQNSTIASPIASSALVRKDLLKTLYVTFALIVILFILSYFNFAYGWTLKAGNIIYELLNIR